ncbi:MAG: NAD-binding protein [Dehalococcoidia bacterium]
MDKQMDKSKPGAGGTNIKPAVKAKPPLIEKIVQWVVDYRLPLAGLMLAVAMVLGFIGHAKYFAAAGQPSSFWDNFYYTLRLLNPASTPLPGSVPAELQVARILAAAAALYIGFEALISIFRDQVQLLRLRGTKDHIIICGLGQKGLLLTDRYRAAGERVVVIESDSNNPMISHCKDQGAIVLMGKAANMQLLRKARVHFAKSIISVCGEDSTNAEVALYSRELVAEDTTRTLSCLAHIVDLQLWGFLREREIRMGIIDAFRLGFFNVYESGARELLYEYPFDRPGAKGEIPHIFVMCIGRMGESLVVNAARRWSAGNDGAQRLRITMVDLKADTRKQSLCLRYPKLETACELTALDMDISSPEFERGDFLFEKDGRCRATIIYVCTGNESQALNAALMLNKKIGKLSVPVIVRMNMEMGLAALLSIEGDRQDNMGNLYVFPLLERTCTPESIWGGSTNEILARAIHDEYRSNAARRGETPETNRSMAHWDQLSANLKESSRSQAENIAVKLRQFGYDFAMSPEWEQQPIKFSDQDVEEMAKLEHTRFVEERLRKGWKPGPVKDDVKKISPTLIPWDDLSQEEKDKDRDPVRSIPEFLARAGYRVYQKGQPSGT